MNAEQGYTTRRRDRAVRSTDFRRCVVLAAAIPGFLVSFAAGVGAQRAPARAGDLFLALDSGPAAATALRVKVCSWCDSRQNNDLRELEPFPFSVGYVNQRASSRTLRFQAAG